MGFSAFSMALSVSAVAQLCENFAKSGLLREYSRFWDTSGEDFFDLDCGVETANKFRLECRLR
jgi:hypothetical protein